MLCEVGTNHGFFALWMVMSVLGLVSMLVLSSALFYPYYVTPTFERWKLKNNPKFPSPELVKKEIIHMCKGLSVATLCPAFTLMASKWGYSQGYCGATPAHALPLLAQTAVIFVLTDFAEYFYHLLGHKYNFLWSIHRHHHMFYNPSPFAVIADEYLDQFVRTWPMVFIPMFLPINMDLMFAIFALLFYGYGVYLHWGYELECLSAHNPVLNTSYHHYMHHAISAKNRYPSVHIQSCSIRGYNLLYILQAHLHRLLLQDLGSTVRHGLSRELSVPPMPACAHKADVGRGSQARLLRAALAQMVAPQLYRRR
jgi:lathosterol oxidase